MKIIIETIPHERQRIPGQVGDWRWITPATLLVQVSTMSEMRHCAAIAVHEVVEALLCWNDGVAEKDVDAFDKAYTGDGKPGDDPAAPYHRQHCFATAVERMLIAALGVPWGDYAKAVEDLR